MVAHCSDDVFLVKQGKEGLERIGLLGNLAIAYIPEDVSCARSSVVHLEQVT